MNWRRLFSSTKPSQSNSETIEKVIKLSTSEALFNRAAIDRETLHIYQRMIAAPSEISDQAEAMRESGRLFAELVNALARQVGKPLPKTPQATLVFLNDELEGFDTVEARERRERAIANELVTILKEGGKEPENGSKSASEDSAATSDRKEESNPLIAPLEKAFGVTKAEADKLWYESSYPASEAYRMACDAARNDLEARFIKVFEQVDGQTVENRISQTDDRR